MGARQAVRAVGVALGMEAPRVNTVARQVALLSSPGAIENVMMRGPERGIAEASAGIEPYNTLLRVSGRLEGLPHRYGAHPSAYTFSFYEPGVLDWLPAHWVSADAYRPVLERITTGGDWPAIDTPLLLGHGQIGAVRLPCPLSL
jgi:hypothetical protein